MTDVLRLENQLCFALHAASRAMTGAYQPLLEELGITYPQYLVLLTLWEEDGARVSRIGERLYLDSATLTPLLKRLEARGLVERRRSSADERVVEVFLSAEGKRLEQKAREIPQALFCKTKLSIGELVRLRATLQELTRTLHEDTED
ncbi:MarR family transcriptional regulator [Archangium minus]|uniref:MarR family transcriptional regulator n=1 Tax=Archangium minus TaxID=83450 RepID=A0ABY9WJQ6_9BACT|nr:MarR family transcriptional regulator [Archangium violaceum]WNG43820.1 MarR family transcriptional regulator [Archangium minus]